MTTAAFDTVSRQELERRIPNEPPENFDSINGYALVNVLNPQAYEREHIPESINIPKGEEDAFEKRFSKQKEIIVYCASRDCDASPAVARRLTEMGFYRVRDYEGGMADWKAGGNPVS